MSHIIPAFVGRWLKDTSATGHLRTLGAPNRRVQDLRKIPLLCQDCEGRISVWEGLFAKHLFLPFHAGRTAFPYDEWCLLFAASLSWRCLVGIDPAELPPEPHHAEGLAEAETSLGAYLLGKLPRPPRYRHNLFFTPTGVRSDGPLPDGLAWYFLRSVDFTPVYTSSSAATYVKIPGMLFWTSLIPPSPGGWRGTLVSRHGTLRSRDQVLQEPGVGPFISSRAEAVGNTLRDGLSQQQRERILATLASDPQRAARSLSLQAALETARIREENDDVLG